MLQAEPTWLLIADISGYTSYLAAVELDHAQDILADLIGTVVTSLRPGFRLAKLEGDAAFVAAPGGKLDGRRTRAACHVTAACAARPCRARPRRGPGSCSLRGRYRSW